MEKEPSGGRCRKTAEGNKPHFAALAVVGNKNGYVGIGYGKARETVPAREKAVRNAKLNVIKIRREADLGSLSLQKQIQFHSRLKAVVAQCA